MLKIKPKDLIDQHFSWSPTTTKIILNLSFNKVKQQVLFSLGKKETR